MVFAVVDDRMRKNWHIFFCLFREISAVATKALKSKELRVWDGVLDVCWVG